MEEEEFVKNKFTAAIILKADLKTIESIKNYLALQNCYLIYTKVSAGKLWVKDGEEGRR